MDRASSAVSTGVRACEGSEGIESAEAKSSWRYPLCLHGVPLCVSRLRQPVYFPVFESKSTKVIPKSVRYQKLHCLPKKKAVDRNGRVVTSSAGNEAWIYAEANHVPPWCLVNLYRTNTTCHVQ
jgi:hypothetical protein